MSTLNPLENVSFEDIENKVMLTLLANPDKTYTKSELYNIVLDKLEASSGAVNPHFKYKYMIILNQLPSKHDVKVTENLVTSGSEVLNTEFKETTSVNLPSMEEVSEFIVENDLLKTTNFNGVPFDLVRNNKIVLVEKLLIDEPLVYFKKFNTENKTPLNYINSQKMTNLFLERIYLKVLEQEKENLEFYETIRKLEEKYENTSISELVSRKVQNFMFKNSDDISSIGYILVGIGLLMVNMNTIKLLLFLNLFFAVFGLLYRKIFSK